MLTRRAWGHLASLVVFVRAHGNVRRIAHLANALHERLVSPGCVAVGALESCAQGRRWPVVIEFALRNEDGLRRWNAALSCTTSRRGVIFLEILPVDIAGVPPVPGAPSSSATTPGVLAVVLGRGTTARRKVLEGLGLVNSPSFRDSVVLLLRSLVGDKDFGRLGLDGLGGVQGLLVSLVPCAPSQHGSLGPVTVTGWCTCIERAIVMEHWWGKMGSGQEE